MQDPFVTIAVPCRDEEAHIETCIRAALAQSWPRDRLEVLVADGMSLDATREILGRLAAEDLRVRLVDNPARIPAAGLNECIRLARGEIVVLMDARSDYAADFVSQCVAALERSGADYVSGSARPRATTFFQRCVAAALQSPLGGDGSKYGESRAKGPTEGGWPGALRRHVFERVGMFDPNATAHEDAELNQRIVAAGGHVFRSPDIVARYAPRESMRALARQYFRHGQASARTLLKHHRLPSLRHALPFLGLVGEVVALVTAPVHGAAVSIAAYAFATGAEAIRVARPEGIAAIPVVWAIFPVLHASHGAGFAAGLVRYAFRPDWAPPERLAVLSVSPAVPSA